MKGRRNRFTLLLSLFLSIAMAVQGPAMAQIVVSVSLPITIIARLTTHPDFYNTRLPLQLVSPVVSDLDNDGVLEVIGAGYNETTRRSSVFVWHRNGTVNPGWPVEIDGRIENLPVAGDLDSDGDLEIAVGVRRNTAEPGGWIYVWHHDGTSYIGSPFELAYRPGALVVGDITGDFAEEVYYQPDSIGMAIRDIDLDGKKELIMAQNDGLGVYKMVNGELTVIPGLAIDLGGAVSVGRPIAGDADGDGLPEILLPVRQEDGNYINIYEWNDDRTALIGRSINAAGVVNTPGNFLSLADINGDGVAEILTGSTNGWIAGWYLDGSVAFSHRPIDNAAIYQPIVGDIDNDGDMEILASSNNANIYRYDHNGNPLDVLPRRTNYELAPGLVLVDIDSDSASDLELLYSAYDGRVYTVDLEGGNFNPNNIQWGMYGFNPRDTGNYTRDWNTAEWSIFDNDPAVAEIESVYDWNRGSRVVELMGDGINNIYRFSRPEARPLNSKNTTLQLAMRFNEPFNIYVSVDTLQGRRYLHYMATEGDEPQEGNIIHHGLGGDADNGIWHTFSRSLVQDLKDAEATNDIVDINAVYVQGSGRIDDIILLPGLAAVDLVNLALIADAVRVSSGSGRFINDGDPETIWVSDGEDDPWVEYTWNEPQRVNKIVIEAVEGATTVDILITDSNGNTSWIRNYVIPPDGVIPFEDTIDNIRSIRVIFKDSEGPVSVGEIGVYYDSNLDDGGGGGGDTGGQTYPSSNYIRIDIDNGYFFNPVTNSPWIPHGIAYQISDPVTGAQRPIGEVRSDLETMAGIGVDAIRVDFVWGQIETEDNAYEDGLGYYDTLLEVAKEKGIKVFPIIGWQQPPGWAPDSWYSMYSDESQANLISFEDTDVQGQLRDFIQAVVRRYSEGGDRQDLGDTIAAWILGNGFSYLDPGSLRYIGYDADSQDAFRLDGGVDMPVSSDYQLTEWREESIADFVALAARAVRAVDTAHLITYTSVGLQYGEEDWGYSSEDVKKIKEACDAAGAPLSFWSINNYPWAQENSELITGQWPIEKARRDTGLPIMITETGFTTTDGIVEISEARQARLVRNAIWEALENGAIGVCVYHWNDRDLPAELAREEGFGIVSIDRTPKPAYSAVQDVFTKMRELNIADYLINSRAPTPDIAFLWDDAVDTTINRYKAEMGALFGTLERLGYEPSFINDLTSLDPSYRALVLPRTQRMFDSIFDLLGGLSVNIHADSDIPGIMDEYGERQVDRIPVINDLFGIDADEIRPNELVFWNSNALSLYDPDINTWTWSARYDKVKSIYTNEGGFNIQPQLNVSNEYILADYRITSDGSLLLSLRNYRADRAETTTVKSDELIRDKTVVDLLTSALIEENSDGEIVRTLGPDGHELLLARAGGGGDTGSGAGTGDGSGGGSGGGSGDGSGGGSGTGGTSSTSSKSTTTTSQPSVQLPTTTTAATTTAVDEDTIGARNYGWGPATVIVLEEEDKKKKTHKDTIGSVETIQAKAQPRPGIRTYTGSGYREAGSSAVSEPVYPEVPAIPPVQQFQYAIEERRDADVGAVRARPQIVSPAQLEKIIKPPQIEFQKSAPAYDIADSINKWISDLKDLWKNLVKRAQVAYNSISRRYV